MSLTKSDVALTGATLAASVFAFDLFPGPALVVCLAVGVASWLKSRRRLPSGRRLLDVFVGMLLALATIVFLALVVH